MRIVTGLAATAALMAVAAAGTASAAPKRLSDVGYMQAARCVGIATSAKMGTPDGEAMAAWLEAESAGRAGYVRDKADEMMRKAKRDAERADEITRARLERELNGACAKLKS